MAKVPAEHTWVFWDVEPAELDTERHADFILPRVLEFGGMAEVQWLLRRYGLGRIHRFLRERGHSELSDRTLGFWRAALRAEGEEWASPPRWRRNTGIPWIE